MSSEETSNLTEEQKDEDSVKDESPKEELSEEESPKKESPKKEAPKEELPEEESQKDESNKEKPSQEESSQSEEYKAESPKSEETKAEPPQSESNQQQSSTSSSETSSQYNDQNSENSDKKPVEDINKRPDIPLEKRYATRSEDTSKYEMKIGFSPLFGKKKSRLPLVKVSPMNYLTQGFNFIVTLNEFMFGFKSVSGLSIDKGYDFITEGGVNDHAIKVGRPTSNDGHKLTFERGLMIRVSTIIEGAAKIAASLIPSNLPRKAALLGLSALNPQESLEIGPALGTIQVYNRSNELTAVYEFLSLGMSEWSVDDLNADSGEVLIEHITIVHTGLIRKPLGVGTIAQRATTLESEYQAAEIREDRAEILAKFKQMNDERAKQAEDRRKAFLAECEAEKLRLKKESERRQELLKKTKEYAEKDIEADLAEKKKEQEEFESIQEQAKKDLEEKLKEKMEENKKESKKMREEYDNKMKELKENGASKKEIEDAKKEYEEKLEKQREKQKEINAKQEAELKEIHKEHNDKMEKIKNERAEKKKENAEKKQEERKERMENFINKLNNEYKDLPKLQLGENGEILEEKEDKKES